jgi:hypothetical protein
VPALLHSAALPGELENHCPSGSRDSNFVYSPRHLYLPPLHGRDDRIRTCESPDPKSGALPKLGYIPFTSVLPTRLSAVPTR